MSEIDDQSPTPNAGQFVKGKSGNPKGRPKKIKSKPATDSSYRDDFLKIAEALMKLTESGKDLQIPAHLAVIRSELLSALRGGSHAQRNFLERYERLLNERMEDIERNHLEWRSYISAYEPMIKGFASRSEPVPDYFPRPDELTFQVGKFVGGWLGHEPIQGAVYRSHYVRLRDLFFLQCEKDRRHSGSKEELNHLSGGLAKFINAILPTSAHLDDVRVIIELGRQRCLRKRELQLRLTEGWKNIGWPEGRNLVTPPIDHAAQMRAFRRLSEQYGT